VSDASATGEDDPEPDEAPDEAPDKTPDEAPDKTPEVEADDLKEEQGEDDLALFAEELEKDDAVDPARGLLETGQGFSLRLPADAVDNILATLKTTPHDGYRPVVAFGPSGQIMLTFEDMKA
jgi:hypothetical protein